GSRTLSRLSALFLAVSVPFLLHARQCRWYGVAYLLVVCLILCLIGLANQKKGAWLGLVASAILLWYTNFFLAVGLLLALAAAAPVYRLERRFITRLGTGLLATGLFTLPSLVFILSLRAGRKIEVIRCLDQLIDYGGQFFVYLLPMPIVIVLISRLLL